MVLFMMKFLENNEQKFNIFPRFQSIDRMWRERLVNMGVGGSRV